MRTTGFVSGWCMAMLLAAPATAGVLDCMPPIAVPVAIRIGANDEVPVNLLLQGGHTAGLQLSDAAGTRRWTAAAQPPATQIFPAMTATFGNSLMPVDTDGDGLHDRLYAGDIAGRLWRFDIHNGAAAGALLTGGPIADLGGSPQRYAFVAPPDVSLSAAGATRWLNVAIGAVRMDAVAGEGRFYVLRDHAPHQSWTEDDYARLRPVVEADLHRIDGPAPAAGAAPDNAPISGSFIVIPRGVVVAASVTVAGRIVVAIARDAPTPATGCVVDVSVASLRLQDEQPVVDTAWSGPIDVGSPALQLLRVPVSTGFALLPLVEDRLTCTFGALQVPECSIRSRWIRRWWLREDAD